MDMVAMYHRGCHVLAVGYREFKMAPEWRSNNRYRRVIHSPRTSGILILDYFLVFTGIPNICGRMRLFHMHIYSPFHTSPATTLASIKYCFLNMSIRIISLHSKFDSLSRNSMKLFGTNASWKSARLWNTLEHCRHWNIMETDCVALSAFGRI